MNTKLKTGDLVVLKSGGPVMTVHNVDDLYKRAHCQWFSGKKLEDGTFPFESLESPPDTSKK